MAKMFESALIGQMELKNRYIMAPLGTDYGELDGTVGQRILDYYTERARGGFGLIIVEVCCVHPTGKAGFPRALTIWDDKTIPGYKKLAQAMHQYGAKVVVQLHHAGKQTSSQFTGMPIVSPSPIPMKALYHEVPRELSKVEIKELVSAYAQGARRVKEAGMDGVEIHGAHGYLINQFLSPVSNHRSDEYGGSIENRSRFLVEIIKAVKDLCGADFPVIVRLSGDEYTEGGNTLNETKVIAGLSEQAGADAIHVSAGLFDSPIPMTTAPMQFPKGCIVHLAEGIKQVVKVPVIAVNRINIPELAEQIVREGRADFVALGRPSIADPHFVIKAEQGRADEIRTCVACNFGCMDRLLFHHSPMKCLVNPEVGREAEFRFIPVSSPKKVMIVGGGPAGMEAARIVALRNHKVFLYEKEPVLGGQVNFITKVPGREEMSHIVAYYLSQFKKLKVEVCLGTEVKKALIDDLSPEAVILATGIDYKLPTLPGMGKSHVWPFWRVFGGGKGLGEKIVLWGEGFIGVDTAIFLAGLGKELIVATPEKRFGQEIGSQSRWLAIQELRKKGVRILNNTEFTEISDDGLIINGEKLLSADNIVIASSMEPDTSLPGSRGEQQKVYHIGDCLKPRNIMMAIHDGARVGKRI